MSAVLFIKILKASTTRLNKNSKRGQPCLKLLLILNRREQVPLTKTAIEAEKTHDLTHFLHLSLKPILVMMKSRNPQSTLSKALSKLTLNINPPFLLFLIPSTTSLAIRAQSKIHLPLMKVNWDFPITSSITTLILLAKTLDTIFYKLLNKLMGR